MTREEQIKTEAKKYYSEDIKCYDAFLHGVEFAEKLSTWISVEEDLPYKHKELLYENPEFLHKSTKLVLIRIKEDIYNVAFMYNAGNGWYWDFELDKITHWMPIPGLNE